MIHELFKMATIIASLIYKAVICAIKIFVYVTNQYKMKIVFFLTSHELVQSRGGLPCCPNETSRRGQGPAGKTQKPIKIIKRNKNQTSRKKESRTKENCGGK